MRMKPTHMLSGGLVVVTISFSATAAPIFEAHMPDFYQHQQSGNNPGDPPDPQPAGPGLAGQNGNWWERGGGWCRTTAWVNALYHYAKKGAAFAGLANLGIGTSWLDEFVFTNEELALWNGTLQGCVSPDRVQDYVDAHAPGLGLTVQRFDWDGAAGKVVEVNINTGARTATTYTSMFDFYAAKLPTEATLLIEFGPQPPGSQTWWGNFHVVTGAGVDAASQKLWFADPDNSADAAHVAGGDNLPHGGGWGFPYDVNPAGHRDNLPVPVQPAALPNAEEYYGVARIAADGRTFDSGAYTGSRIERFYMLPEPGTLAVMFIVSLGALSRRTRRHWYA